jgi:iron complex outermembrane receptor protein
MQHKKLLSLAISSALGLTSSFMLTQNAVAQDEQADEAEEFLEEVIVTGSRIKRADVDSASPVTVLERADMEAMGLVDVGSLIQRMPAMSGSPIGTTTNNGGNGTVQIDLRGMGVNRTLTLVNGQRVVDGGDYQTIPAAMIERVEILKDGASAVYGADAVAGVVNIITRRDFDGIELSVQTADWFDAKGKQDSFGMIAGKEFESGNFVFGAEYVKQEAAFQSDLPWDYFQNSYYIYPPGCENQVAAPYDATPSGGCYPIGSSRIPESRLTTYSQGRFLIGTPATTPYEVGLMELHDGRTYNYAPVNYMQTPFERTNVFGEAHFDLTDNIRFNVEFRGNKRTSAQRLAPLPYTDTDPAYDGFYEDPATGSTVAFHGVSPDNYYLRRAFDAYNAANDTSLVYEPVGVRRRMIETDRHFTQEITQYQWVAGLEGVFRDMDWDVYINEGYRTRTDNDAGQFSGQRLSNAMGPSADLVGDDGMPECYQDLNNPDTLIVGCVPMNFFGGGVVDPVTSQPVLTTLTQDMIDYATVTLVDAFNWKQRSAGASLTGSNFDLPAGEIGWAVGWSYWKQEYTYAPDSNKVLGEATGNVGAGTEGSLTNNALYGEILVPVFDNGTQNLYLKGGLRYDDWNAFDGDTTYQIGLEFQAVDSVKLRATYGTVFRAPTISELFGGEVDSFPTFSDPCNEQNFDSSPGCAQVAPQYDNQLHARVGGNPNLIPETGDTFTAGVVWTPEFGDHSLTVTVDYWQIAFDDGISSLGADFILTNCYVDQNPDACALVTRNADYTINLLSDANLNVASQGGKGVDTEIRWDYPTNYGQLQASLLWAHLMERTKTAFEGDDEDDLSGRFTDPTAVDNGAYATDKVSYSFQWMWNDLSIGYLGEYISSLDADTFCNCFDEYSNTPAQDGTYIQDIPSQLYHDLVATYTFDTWGSTTQIAGGVTNLTDEAPPYMDVGFNANTDPSTYRMFGRGYYLRLTWKY